jgi:hypothetical protein
LEDALSAAASGRGGKTILSEALETMRRGGRGLASVAVSPLSAEDGAPRCSGLEEAVNRLVRTMPALDQTSAALATRFARFERELRHTDGVVPALKSLAEQIRLPDRRLAGSETQQGTAHPSLAPANGRELFAAEGSLSLAAELSDAVRYLEDSVRERMPVPASFPDLIAQGADAGRKAADALLVLTPLVREASELFRAAMRGGRRGAVASQALSIRTILEMNEKTMEETIPLLRKTSAAAQDFNTLVRSLRRGVKACGRT